MYISDRGRVKLVIVVLPDAADALIPITANIFPVDPEAPETCDCMLIKPDVVRMLVTVATLPNAPTPGTWEHV
jgi:hypothetical protein